MELERLSLKSGKLTNIFLGNSLAGIFFFPVSVITGHAFCRRLSDFI